MGVTHVAPSGLIGLEEWEDDHLGAFEDPTVGDGDMILRSNTTDHALTGTASRGSTIDAPYNLGGGQTDAFINDGNESTFINTGNWVRDDLWNMIDLGQDREVTAYRVLMGTGGGDEHANFVIEWSPDNASETSGWTTVSTQSTYPGGDSGIVNLASAVTARYWRIRGNPSAGNSHGWKIYTLSFFGSAAGRIATTEIGRSVLSAETAVDARGAIGASAGVGDKLYLASNYR